MIKIEAFVSYDKPLTKSEEARIADAIHRILQPTLANAACSQVQDAVVGDDGSFSEPEHIRSQFLNIDTKITWSE